MALGDFLRKIINPRYLVTADDNIIVVKLMAADTEVTNTDIQVTCNAEGKLYGTLEFDGDLTLTMGDVERLLAGQYYKRGKPYTYPSGRIKYKTKNTNRAAAEADTDWWIWKFSDAAIPEDDGPQQGAVNTEAVINGLSWNI